MKDGCRSSKPNSVPSTGPACVWNCPASNEVVSEPRAAVTCPIWLLYHGSIVPDRLPGTVLDALTSLPDSVMLRVVGYETVGSRGYIAELMHRSETLGLQNRVEFLKTIPQRADLLRITAESDIGLALMPKCPSDWNCETMTGASNKAFDYLACGLALVVTDLPDWRETFIEPGYARGCDPGDPRSIAAAILYMVENLGRMRAMGESGRNESFQTGTTKRPSSRCFSFLQERDSRRPSKPGGVIENAA